MSKNITSTKQHLIACEECGLVVAIPNLPDGHDAHCPRCEHILTHTIRFPYQRPIAYAAACLIMLVLSLCFSFMSFSVQGIEQQITLFNAVQILDEFHNLALAILLLGTIIVFPGLYVTMLIFLYGMAAIKADSPQQADSPSWLKPLCRTLFKIEPWLMVDVFLIGVLVSLIKIASLADIAMGVSFWAFCAYACLLVKCVALVDRNWLWERFFPSPAIAGVSAGDTHQSGNHVSCHLCHQIHPVSRAELTNHNAKLRCTRCHSRLHPVNSHVNLQKAWALLIAAIVFYFPANLYPIMNTVSLGKEDPATILGGVILLWEHGSYPIALVIFTASIFIPIAKMLALAWLFYSAEQKHTVPLAMTMTRLKIYRVTEFIGRWSMIDVFVVALLVALVQLNNLMAIYPGPAALSFASVVIFTMLSAMMFDSRLLWEVCSEPEADVNNVRRSA